MSIKSFKDKETGEIANGKKSKRSLKRLPSNLHYVAYKKLVFLDNIGSLESLRAWPSLRLERLKGDRKGWWSIRINDQYRICFDYADGHVSGVEIVDYH